MGWCWQNWFYAAALLEIIIGLWDCHKPPLSPRMKTGKPHAYRFFLPTRAVKPMPSQPSLFRTSEGQARYFAAYEAMLLP